MSEIMGYLDTQSDIQLMTNVHFIRKESKTTDLLFLLKGDAHLTIGDQKYKMTADDLVVINKSESYEILACDQEALLFYFSISDFLLSQALDSEFVWFNCHSIENPTGNYAVIRKIIFEIIDLQLFEASKTNFLQISKVYHLLNELSSLFLEESITLEKQDDRIKQITRTMKERYYENITLTDMAELVHMDVAYFSKFFKKSLGINFKDYLAQIRMNYAYQDLLQSEKTITRIAVDNGFFSVNSFNKKFKENYRDTPSEYRKKALNETMNKKQEKSAIKSSYTAYKESKGSDELVANQSFLQLDVKSLNAKPIKETWCTILNVGSAEMVLNRNVREHLGIIQQSVQFKYGRIWAIFTTKLIGDALSDYEVIDDIIDSLLELSLLPWLTINKFVSDFKESSYPLEKWNGVIQNFCRHILNRYGRQQVETWKIEIVASNPEESDSIARYAEFYQTTYDSCKKMIPELSIGGGSFVWTKNLALEKYLKEELSHCTFDYYSFVLFPYSNRYVREKRNFQRVTDPDFLQNQMNVIEQLNLDKPLYISEWSNTVSRSNILNDSLFKGAFIIKSMIDIFDHVAGLGYWLGTDLAQKNPKNYALLTGGNGLITKNSLFKPAMNAMKFFDQLKNLAVLYKDKQHLICLSEEDEFFILGHQYTHPNSLYFLKDEAHLKLSEVDTFFEEKEHEDQLVLTNIPNGTYELRIFSCLKEHGDLYGQWEKFHFSRDLRLSDLRYLEEKNTHLQTLAEVVVTEHRLVIRKILTTNEFYLINIRKRQ